MQSKTNAHDPLDRAAERLARADEATKLLEYSEDFEEPTGRHEVTVNLHGHPSQHEIERPSSDPPQAKVAVSFIKAVRGWPQAITAVALLFFVWAIGRGKGWW